MLKTPLNKERIQYHWHYNKWKYGLVLVGVILVLNLMFSVTQYRPPEDKKVELFVSASGANQEALQAFLDTAHNEILPDMEAVSCITMMSNDGSDPYTAQQLSVYIMAGEGDIYMLSKQDFAAYAAQGAMLNLEPYIEEGLLNAAGVDLKKGMATYFENEDAAGETHVYGIPADELFGFWDFQIDNRDMVLAVMLAGQNDDNSVKLLEYMVTNLKMPMPVYEEAAE